MNKESSERCQIETYSVRNQAPEIRTGLHSCFQNTSELLDRAQDVVARVLRGVALDIPHGFPSRLIHPAFAHEGLETLRGCLGDLYTHTGMHRDCVMTMDSHDFRSANRDSGP